MILGRPGEGFRSTWDDSEVRTNDGFSRIDLRSFCTFLTDSNGRCGWIWAETSKSLGFTGGFVQVSRFLIYQSPACFTDPLTILTAVQESRLCVVSSGLLTMYLLRGIYIGNNRPKSGVNCVILFLYIFPGAGMIAAGMNLLLGTRRRAREPMATARGGWPR